MAKNSKTVHFYRTYKWGGDHDPIIDTLHTAVDDSKLTLEMIHQKSNVSTTTLRNWFDGKTKKPQFTTVAAAFGALGYKLVPTKRGE